ncbi:MAG: RNA polymerase sigma factor [Saprospiraceae bacterium]|jgi:RNA polymerase sigma-70 factor (ECF subfamily)|nr:RNA polymerase sigma factor [Saprospiraceae bacterium]
MTDLQQNILARCRNGERMAQQQLYEHFKGKMFAVCLRYANSRHDAEDVLQEGFVKVFRDLHQFRGEGSFEGWMRRVIVNVALQHLRKQKGGLQFTELENVEYRLTDADESVFDENEKGAALIKLMQKMPTGFRTVLNLYVLEEFSHQEIADQMGISVGTSKSQLNRAKAYLKGLLEKNLAG